MSCLLCSALPEEQQGHEYDGHLKKAEPWGMPPPVPQEEPMEGAAGLGRIAVERAPYQPGDDPFPVPIAGRQNAEKALPPFVEDIGGGQHVEGYYEWRALVPFRIEAIQKHVADEGNGKSFSPVPHCLLDDNPGDGMGCQVHLALSFHSAFEADMVCSITRLIAVPASKRLLLKLREEDRKIVHLRRLPGEMQRLRHILKTTMRPPPERLPSLRKAFSLDRR